MDDDPAFLRSLSEVLTAHGSEVSKAESLPQALEFMETNDPSIVVLDLRLHDIHPTDAVIAIKDVSPGGRADSL